MSVSLFPNATEDKVDDLGLLMEQLLPKGHLLDPTARAAFDLIVCAHLCAIADAILHSSDIQSCHPYDPQLVSQIRSVLYSCR